MLGLSIFGKLALVSSAIITGYYIALTILMLITTLIIMPTLD